jgi:hypothetical protein
MARKQKILEPYIPMYYAYYDEKNGNILSVTNEKNAGHAAGIEISYDEFDKFVSGREKFSDFLIGHVRTPDNKTILSIMPTSDQGYAFKNNIFEWITSPPLVSTELVVTWDANKRNWSFDISTECKDRLLTGVCPSKFIFFVMLSDDFDFLIRTIMIETSDLINGQVNVVFNSKFEDDITRISIASKLFFESYGLKINE